MANMAKLAKLATSWPTALASYEPAAAKSIASAEGGG